MMFLMCAVAVPEAEHLWKLWDLAALRPFHQVLLGRSTVNSLLGHCF